MVETRTDGGQGLALVALAMIVVLGFLGLGIDLGYLRYMKRQLQGVADAAALAGATELSYCGGMNNCSALTTAAQSALTENGFTGSTLLTGCSTGSGTLTVTVNNPPCYLGSKANDSHYGDNHYVEVVVSQQEPTYFAKIFGVKSVTLIARAEANLPGGGSCVFTTGTSGTDIYIVLSYFTSSCGVVDESSSLNAFSGFWAAYDVPYFGIVGGNSCFWCFAAGGATAITGITTPSPADPLQYLQTSLAAGSPSPTTCGTSTKSPYTGHNGPLAINSTATLNPGTYCGGITISPGANVTMNSGIYTLTSTSGSNGGLSIDAGTSVTGNGVGFYNYGPNGGVNFLFSSMTAGAVTLTAPNATNCATCATAWQGILFYQDPGDSAASIVVGSASWNTKLTGTSYFPSANVTYALDFQVNYNELVAKSVTLGASYYGVTVNSNFFNNYSELANGNPIKNTIAVLAE
jgi:Flp pilus assembly protein TadG